MKSVTGAVFSPFSGVIKRVAFACLIEKVPSPLFIMTFDENTSGVSDINKNITEDGV